MKKYILFSFLFLLVAIPVVAKSANSNSTTQIQSQNQIVTTTAPVQNQSTTVTPVRQQVQTQTTTVSPTGNLVKNQNQVQTQNQGEGSKLMVKTKENEQLNQEVDDSVQKVSTQVQELIDTVGAKSGIGQQVKEIAQNQQQNQEKIKSSVYELKNRGQLVRLFVGSDKKMTNALGQMIEENKLTIQKLEAMKNLTKNKAELTQLQETIDLMIYQNTSLDEKIAKENQVNGLFGWFTRLFNKK